MLFHVNPNRYSDKWCHDTTHPDKNKPFFEVLRRIYKYIGNKNQGINNTDNIEESCIHNITSLHKCNKFVLVIDLLAVISSNFPSSAEGCI